MSEETRTRTLRSRAILSQDQAPPAVGPATPHRPVTATSPRPATPSPDLHNQRLISPIEDNTDVSEDDDEENDEQESTTNPGNESSWLLDVSEIDSTPRIQSNFADSAAIDGHLDKLLECPVCLEVTMPPILCCEQGHSCCNTCRGQIARCPVCRGKFTNVRNLFAEQFLENCKFRCKFGCDLVLPAKELVEHYKGGCERRPIFCRECDLLVPFLDYLSHVQKRDKLERQKASECSTGFEIDAGDLSNLFNNNQDGDGRCTVWEPTWMFCYGCNFFCNLDYDGNHWWIWVAGFEKEAMNFKCQIILWSKETKSEHTYFGEVHSIRTEPDEVLGSGKCLILTHQTLRNFMYGGGIDVLVRIEGDYKSPKTRRGYDVQSPLEIMDPNRPRKYSLRSHAHHAPPRNAVVVNNPTTPVRVESPDTSGVERFRLAPVRRVPPTVLGRMPRENRDARPPLESRIPVVSPASRSSTRAQTSRREVGRDLHSTGTRTTATSTIATSRRLFEAAGPRVRNVTARPATPAVQEEPEVPPQNPAPGRYVLNRRSAREPQEPLVLLPYDIEAEE